MLIKSLTKVASTYAPSRPLSFDIVHIFKTLQMIKTNGHVSRALLAKELALGQGVIRTLVRHMKRAGLIETTNSGTKMTHKGLAVYSELVSAIPAETPISFCSIAVSKFNYAVLLKSLAYSIHTGIEQRDAALRLGGAGATTLLFLDDKFVMPNSSIDCLCDDSEIRKALLEKLGPENGDVIIIGTSDHSAIIAELAAKHAALHTLKSHDTHM